MEPTEQLSHILPAVSTVVDRIRQHQLDDPTPCDQFTVHDVIDHMIVLGGTLAYLFRGEQPPGSKPYYVEPRFARAGGRFYVQHGRTYIDSAQRFDEVPRLTEEQDEAMRLIDSLANDDRFREPNRLTKGCGQVDVEVEGDSRPTAGILWMVRTPRVLNDGQGRGRGERARGRRSSHEEATIEDERAMDGNSLRGP